MVLNMIKYFIYMYKHILMKSFVLYNQFCDKNEKLTHSSIGIQAVSVL